MIPVKEAVTAAEKYVKELYDPTDIPHLRLEEVELSSDEKHWHVTVSWVEPAVERLGGSNPFISPNYSIEKRPRVFKDVRVDAETGRPVGLKIHGSR